MFMLEQFIHHKHSHKKNGPGHGHAYSIAPINLVGDGVHNFIDGLVIAGSYAVSTTLGISATISIIFHEIPQEIADFGVLLYSGMSKKKALMFNGLSAVSAVGGAVLGLILSTSISNFTNYLIPFAAGNFLYIAASNLIPQLHRDCSTQDMIKQVIAICFGVAIIVLVGFFSPSH